MVSQNNNKRRNSIELDINKKQNINTHSTNINRRLSLKNNLNIGKQDLKTSEEKSQDNKEKKKKTIN